MATAQRRSTSLTLDSALLRQARSLGVNISRAAEAGLSGAVADAQRAAWQEENRAAIEEYNSFIDARGVPLSRFRKF